MAFEIEYAENEKLLQIIYSGPLDALELQLSHSQTAAYLEHYPETEMILLDFREAVPETSFVELMAFAANQQQESQEKVKTASILSEQDFAAFDTYAQQAMRASKNLIAFFKDEEEARAWLKE